MMETLLSLQCNRKIANSAQENGKVVHKADDRELVFLLAVRKKMGK
jgi:hypothetical protein